MSLALYGGDRSSLLGQHPWSPCGQGAQDFAGPKPHGAQDFAGPKAHGAQGAQDFAGPKAPWGPRGPRYALKRLFMVFGLNGLAIRAPDAKLPPNFTKSRFGAFGTSPGPRDQKTNILNSRATAPRRPDITYSVLIPLRDCLWSSPQKIDGLQHLAPEKPKSAARACR